MKITPEQMMDKAQKYKEMLIPGALIEPINRAEANLIYDFAVFVRDVLEEIRDGRT